MTTESDTETGPEQTPETGPAPAAEPQPVEVIDALYERLGEPGVKRLVQECLRATDRGRAVSLINEYVGTVRLSPATDRGRIGRVLAEGLHRRRTPVLDVVQTLARDPFELQARPQAQDKLDEAVQSLNDARGSGKPEDLAAASKQVVAALRQVIDAEQARRLLLVNAFPDTIEPLLAALEADSPASP